MASLQEPSSSQRFPCRECGRQIRSSWGSSQKNQIRRYSAVAHEKALAVPVSIFLDNIARSTTETQLRNYLSKWGQILRIFISRKKRHNNINTFAFVVINGVQGARKVIRGMNGLWLNGVKVRARIEFQGRRDRGQKRRNRGSSSSDRVRSDIFRKDLNCSASATSSCPASTPLSGKDNRGGAKSDHSGVKRCLIEVRVVVGNLILPVASFEAPIEAVLSASRVAVPARLGAEPAGVFRTERAGVEAGQMSHSSKRRMVPLGNDVHIKCVTQPNEKVGYGKEEFTRKGHGESLQDKEKIVDQTKNKLNLAEQIVDSGTRFKNSQWFFF